MKNSKLKMKENDTIAAISTPAGEGGIGIVRISGPCSLKIAGEIFEGGRGKEYPRNFASYTVHYGHIVDGNERIDEVILTVMRAPKTYTREDVAEINCHSGIVPLRKILELVVRKGARPADPGEFTKRAFLNGRIDLSQAEAVADIISAKTELSLKSAMLQLEGGISSKIRNIRAGLLDLLARIEASIDFPDEDINDVPAEILKSEIDLSISKLKKILSTFEKGRMLREGVYTAIIGRPNVGKSSLMNCLLGEKRAIVTPVPGTTTDTIEENVEIGGARLKVVDTAGIGSGSKKSVIEAEGVKRARSALKNSDLLLLVLDGSRPMNRHDKVLLRDIEDRKAIVVINKIDLKRKLRADAGGILSKFKTVEISAKKEINIGKLRSEISKAIWGGGIEPGADAILTNIRHKEAMSSTLKNLISCLKSGSNEFAALDVKEAVESLGRITGETVTEDILDRIFSKFCVGK